jgi:hypothetical protein
MRVLPIQAEAALNNEVADGVTQTKITKKPAGGLSRSLAICLMSRSLNHGTHLTGI